MPDSELKRIADELTAIKRLLVVALIESGLSQRDVAKALGVNQSSISRILGGAPHKRKSHTLR